MKEGGPLERGWGEKGDSPTKAVSSLREGRGQCNRWLLRMKEWESPRVRTVFFIAITPFLCSLFSHKLW